MVTIHSRFIGEFKTGDNIVYNLAIWSTQDSVDTQLSALCVRFKDLRWSHFLRQPAKVGSSILRMTDHEDAETIFV